MSQIASWGARAAPVVDALYAAAIGVLIALLAYFHFQIITAPAPIEVFEGTMVYFTELFARGQNPFTFEMQPEAMYVYTPLYNLVVAPLTYVFGNSVELHRVVSGICVLLSCGLLTVSARKLGARWVDCAAVGVLAYAALLYYATPIAAGGGLGEVLFLSAILVPWLRQWSARSLIASALLGILAFYSKQYFLLSLGIVSVYLFLSVSKLRSVIYAAGSGALLIATLAIAHLTSPYFLADTLFSVSNTTRIINTLDRLIVQLIVFAQTYPGLLLLMAVVAVAAAIKTLKTAGWTRSFIPRILPLDAPLFSAKLSYPWVCFAITTAAIVFSLGQNPGAYMSYLFQLMSPFLLLSLCDAPPLRTAWRPLVLPLYMFSFFAAYNVLEKNFEVTPDAWARIEEIVCAADTPYVSGVLVMSTVKCSKPAFNSGHTGYFGFAELPGPFRPQDPSREPAHMWEAYLEEMRQGVRDQRFDVLVLARSEYRFMRNNPGDLERTLIRQYYRIDDHIPLSFSQRLGGGLYTVQVWRPLTPQELSERVERGNRARARERAGQQAPLP